MRLHIIGDSTASIKVPLKRPETGWGEKINLFLSEDVEIFNHAVNGKSTHSFITEKLFDKVLNELEENDVLIIQFGHNDSKIEDLNRYADPLFNYPRNLEFMVKEARKKGAFPIILSSVSRRYFRGKHNVNKYSVGIYPYVARKVAKYNDVLFIDTFKKTKQLYEYLGFDNSRKLFLQLFKGEHPNYPDGIYDDTHFNDLGATVVASIIAEGLYFTKKLQPLKPFINPEYLIRWVDIKRVTNV